MSVCLSVCHLAVSESNRNLFNGQLSSPSPKSKVKTQRTWADT